MPTQIQLRRGTSTQWTSANPTLASGEMGVETNTGQFKIGNGSTAWNSLSYGGLQGPAGSSGDWKLLSNTESTVTGVTIANASNIFSPTTYTDYVVYLEAQRSSTTTPDIQFDFLTTGTTRLTGTFSGTRREFATSYMRTTYSATTTNTLTTSFTNPSSGNYSRYILNLTQSGTSSPAAASDFIMNFSGDAWTGTEWNYINTTSKCSTSTTVTGFCFPFSQNTWFRMRVYALRRTVS